ncbi:ankyrin repeat domain-containing protein [Vibrio kyushuensis]|uniref:ankyrin repeat domain-containing protein n=1 Tax=Vibrio kyushuensis TaxID=2910249 RepID=UPI003D0D406F
MFNSALETINRLLTTIALLMVIAYGWQHAFSPRAKNVQMIQEAGYNIDSSSLTDAIMYGDENIVKALLNFDLDPSRPDIDGYTPLILAVESEQSEVINLLISKGADINGIDPEGGYPIWYAVDSGNLKLIKQLVGHGASLNELDDLKQTILMYASSEGKRELIELGIQAGVSPMSQDLEGDTMLHYAAYGEMYETYEWIADQFPQLIGVKNTDGFTALDIVSLN